MTTTGPDAPWHSIAGITEAIAEGAFSVAELVEATLARIDRREERLHAWSRLWPERARARAKSLDALPPDARGPLHGVPIAVKDLCDVAGEPTRAGTVALGGVPAREDATVVRRLVEAGAVVLGKVKMTEGAFTTHHPSVEPPVNPWRADRWTGISSSGSGVAVAAGECTAAIGTDTGGSIRYPSAACGLVGLKPTHGRVSLAGVFPLAPSLDHVGPMARSVDDVARLFAVLAGPDPRDPATWPVPPPDLASLAPLAGARAAAGLRVGFDPEACSDGVDDAVEAGVARILEALGREGAEIREIALPPVAPALAAWLPICASEAARAHAYAFPSRRDEYGASLATLLETGLGLTAVDLAAAWQQRIAHARQWAGVYDACDVVVCPGLAVRFPADLDLAARPAPDGAMTAMRFTLPFDLTGDPTLSLPCGHDAEGAPVGIQLAGPSLSEPRLLGLGGLIEARGETAVGHPPALDD
jgi:amidase